MIVRIGQLEGSDGTNGGHRAVTVRAWRQLCW